jgi:hypothetical protein
LRGGCRWFGPLNVRGPKAMQRLFCTRLLLQPGAA